MNIPSNVEIIELLKRLDSEIADDLESSWLEFKPWEGPKDSRRQAVESAICLANAEGGVIVFGVADGTPGRDDAIHGVRGHDVDVWKRDIYETTRPNLMVEVDEITVPEGTGKLLVVRVPKGSCPPYGTSQGVFKKRVGKHCMPLDPASFMRSQIESGALDWSGATLADVGITDLDPVEIARARNILRSKNPESELLKLNEFQFLQGLGVIKGGKVTHAGLLLFGKSEVLADLCPQHQVHYVHQTSETEVSRNDSYTQGLLNILERIEQNFSGPANPEQELSIGLSKLRIPAYHLDVVREALLNAVTHRDYTDPGEVLIRHTSRELVLTSPGGFISGITPENILRVESVSRNKTLAEAFQKLRLVERAGVGRKRIFLPTLAYGKRPPVYESDGNRVTLRIFDGVFDKRMAMLVAKWRSDGVEVDLDGLLILFHLRERAFVDSRRAAHILQLSQEDALHVLDRLTRPPTAILERRGRTKSTTYHLTKSVASDLLGKAAYSDRGINPIKYAEMIRNYLDDHKTITPKQCRELLHLGESQSAKVYISRLLKKWCEAEGFLRRQGNVPKISYFLRDKR